MAIYYTSMTAKIDNFAIDGLTGVEGSLGYDVNEIDVHLHSNESWFETASVPAGETHVADRIGSGGGAFQVDGGNLTWGAWVQVLGSSDTPGRSGMTKFDLHRLEIKSAEKAAAYFVQVAGGESGAAGLAAGTYTEFIYIAAAGLNDGGPEDLQVERLNAGAKVWVRCLCEGENTGTIDFFIGIHEYVG